MSNLEKNNDTNNMQNTNQNLPEQSPNGVLILVFGILGVVTCGILGIVAWVMGNSEIKIYPNDSNVKVGRILGIVGTCLLIVGVVLIIIYFIFIIGFFATYRDFTNYSSY